MLLRRLLLAASLTLLPLGAWAGPVNINSADAATIAASLNGIGLKKAEEIVAYRKANGPFKSVDDLAKVKGVGKKTIEANRQLILLK
jgi:competence protein ComEA helix-hairpin-helix repeat region